MNERNKEYLELLRCSFDENSFINFVKDLLNLSPSDIANNFNEKTDVSKQFEDNIKHYKYIAKYNDGLNNNIGIFIVKLSDKTTSNARNIQRNFVAKLLSTYDLDASLVSFYSDKETSWRISFVKKELSFGDKGFKEVLTPAKRYSYLVGEHESVHTAKEFLLKLLSIDSRKITLADIESVFDVEKVTKKFFEEYKEKYLLLKEYLDKNQDFKTESEKYDFNSVEFAKKLMGQIVFLYFLQKKGWLGVDLIPNQLSHSEYGKLLSQSDSVSQNLIESFYELKDGEYVINKNELRQAEEQDINNFTNIFIDTEYNKQWGSGEKGFIRSIYKQAIKEHRNFFEEYLEPFFYKGLNEKRENQYFSLFNCKVPFLNGGLFEPLNGYRWSSSHFNIPNNMFSNEDKDGILDFLDLYNFTIDEEEPLEKEVAVDPEMLGKIFENLLEVDDRKSKGAFYTPREIVYYMCQESLANYLVTKVGVDYNEIIKFIKYGDLISQIDWESSNSHDYNFEIGSTIYKNIVALDRTLIDVKVADPAVGSGAFPLGMLTEIVKLRNNLTVYMMIQNELEIINIGNLSHTEQNKRDIFDMKLQTIENCIYAVDTEISAVDIAKLRLWLSLIVDYPNNEEPKPLPNLDCKIMQGNSLIDEYEGVALFSEKIIDNSLKNYRRKDSKLKNVKDIHIQQSLQFDDSHVDLNIYIEQMIELQREYFKASDNKLKKELKSKIENIQLGMVQESLKNEPKKLKEFLTASKKKQKPWFIWELEFYDVFKHNGGFDIVIGNPPYVGEKGNAKVFNPINNTQWGRKFHIGRMDLFYYFFHKAIDISTENGEITFITTNYYITATGGTKLRLDFKNRTNIRRLINFDEFKIFESALGQHNMITMLNKENDNNYISKLTFIPQNTNLSLSSILNAIDDNGFTQSVIKEKLYDGDKNYIRFPTMLTNNISSGFDTIFQKIKCNESVLLGKICNVNQGARTGADKVTDKHIAKYKNLNLQKGNGIFVLTKKEVESNNLGSCGIIKPWFKCSDIYKYSTNIINKYDVIFSYKNEIEKSENINAKEYLSQFKIILSDRNSEYSWWCMDRTRNPEIFKSEKIVAPQRSKSNIFGYNDIDWYASADVYFITKKDNDCELKYILGLLNSKLYYFWLYYRGKRKGEMLELYQEPLSEIPIIFKKDSHYTRLIEHVNAIMSEKRKDKILELQKDIDKTVYEIYGVNNEEITYIEKLYTENISDDSVVKNKNETVEI